MVRHLGESYDNVVLTAGFSKAYSSLLAFVACPSDLKRMLKVAVPRHICTRGRRRSPRWRARWSGSR